MFLNVVYFENLDKLGCNLSWEKRIYVPLTHFFLMLDYIFDMKKGRDFPFPDFS